MERSTTTVTENERLALDKIECIIEVVLESSENSALKLLGPNGEEIELPDSVSRTLRQLVHYLAQDQAVMVVPMNKDLTTQEAADLLRISRPYLVKLLEEGAIPFTKTGTHRRVQLRDVLKYRERRSTERTQALSELTQLSQELGLYDE